MEVYRVESDWYYVKTADGELWEVVKDEGALLVEPEEDRLEYEQAILYDTESVPLKDTPLWVIQQLEEVRECMTRPLLNGSAG